MNWKDPQPCSGNKHDTLISQLVLKAHAGHKALVTLICRIAWLGKGGVHTYGLPASTLATAACAGTHDVWSSGSLM